MELKDYPRPPQDTGIGMHWSPGNSGSVGAGELRETWIPQLQRMGVKWVKMLHPGGLELAELLLEADIMPIVRIYRHRPNSKDLRKAVLRSEEIDWIKEYLAVGVRYFEFNNEPELPSEWEGGSPPPNAIDYVARAAIVDMETILGLGGYPAVPATAIGTTWDLIGKIIEHGGDYLFDEPVWLAVHNYNINHPLDYPYDRVNRRGVLLTPKEYRAMGTDAWTGPRWGSRALAFINEQRKKGKNPRADIHDDPSGFLAFQRLAELSMKHLGRYLPVISTESGPIVGEDDDPRYPTTTPDLHAQVVVETARIMMGTSHRYDPAPDYYFATAFWLMGAAVLRAKGWEGHAWFSPRWPNGHLPAVEALEELNKRPRRYEFEEDLIPIIIGDRARSIVSGVIYGYPNMRVILRSAGYAADTYTDDQGRFRLEHLPKGKYRLSVPGTEIVRFGIELDGRNHVELTIGDPPIQVQPHPTPATPEEAWRVRVEDAGEASGFSIIRVRVEGKAHLPVRITADGWEGIVRETGSKPEYGPYALEFSPLGPGQYVIEPEGLDVQARVALENNQVIWVTFRPSGEEPEDIPDETPAQGRIEGIIARGAGMRVRLTGPNGQVWDTFADNQGHFSFDALPAGEYELHLPDINLVRKLTLNDEGALHLELEAPEVEVSHYSTISGRVMHGAGRTVLLKGPGVEMTTIVDENEHYMFTGLGPGQYYVRVKDTPRRRGGLRMTGRNHRVVNFSLPSTEPSDSVIQGRIPGGEGWQVYMRAPDGREVIQALDEDGEFAFTGLKAGEYELILHTPDGEFVERITVDGVNRFEVHFSLPTVPLVQEEPDIPLPDGLKMMATAETNTPPEARDWTWEVKDVGVNPGFGIIRVRMPHQQGRAVRLWADGWVGMVRRIGEKPEYGPDVCEFAPLGKGTYYLQPEGMDSQVTIEMPGAREIWVTFSAEDQPQPAPQPQQPKPTKDIPIFLLVRSMPYDLPGFIQALRFATTIHAPVDDDLENALRAEKVIVLANSDDFSKEEEKRLREAGCDVLRVAPPYYATTLYDMIQALND